MQTVPNRYLKIPMCIISLSQPKCCAQRQVCRRLFDHSFINSVKEKHQTRNLDKQPFQRTFHLLRWVHFILTYCSLCVKSNGRHWWLRRACATCHQPKCKETLLCVDGDRLSGSEVWFHSDDHCFPIPGTCKEKSPRGQIENTVQNRKKWPLCPQSQ